ncbi:MAG: hypothetical protein H6Q65_2729, partial [Firmicutes bacterium]|nr:hypothetical protein [Bacillota bacterium]
FHVFTGNFHNFTIHASEFHEENTNKFNYIMPIAFLPKIAFISAQILYLFRI